MVCVVVVFAGEDTKTRFSVTPSPGDSGFTQWQNGMRAVARLPEGIPPQFRKTVSTYILLCSVLYSFHVVVYVMNKYYDKLNRIS